MPIFPLRQGKCNIYAAGGEFKQAFANAEDAIGPPGCGGGGIAALPGC